MELKEIKKQYSVLAKKYQLPSFESINEDFEVDKIDRDTDCLLRMIRKVMAEKIINSANFLEMLMNPVNAPRMYITYVRSISIYDRKMIEEIYESLGKASLLSLDLEIDYSEKKEAETIKEIRKIWEEQKPKFRK